MPEEEHSAAAAVPPGAIADDGQIAVSAFDLPASGLLSAESLGLFVEQARLWEAIGREQAALQEEGASIEARRAAYSRALAPTLAKQRRLSPVREHLTSLGGKPVTIFEPERCCAPDDALLISLHGGGFMFGQGAGEAIEAVPIAASTGIQVVSVDYRMAPEHSYPAASDDVIAVYEALVARHPDARIGICGSSAGALLAAQTASILAMTSELPGPAALGMFGLGATRTALGDSMRIFGTAERFASNAEGPYFEDSAGLDHHAFPAHALGLERFPRSLLISSTRDLGLSSAAATHARLVAAGVPAELHVWEGLRHCFYYDPDFTEAQEAFDVIGRFFRTALVERATGIGTAANAAYGNGSPAHG